MSDYQRERSPEQKAERKVVGITSTMLTKCLRELEADGMVARTQTPTIPPTVEYSLTEKGSALVPALDEVFAWAKKYQDNKE